MNGVATRGAAALVRAWTRLYTRGLPDAEREARLAEIESDLWELQHDFAPTTRLTSLHILVRLLAGVADDIGWRRDLREVTMTRARTITSLTSLAVVAVAALAFFLSNQRIDWPALPPSLQGGVPRWMIAPVPPPPPPPPPPPAGASLRRSVAMPPPPPPPPTQSR